MSPLEQAKLCALIRHFSEGDFNSFLRICGLALSVDEVDSYTAANVLLAYQLSGVCEVGTKNGYLHWWNATSADVELRVGSGKVVGLSAGWLCARPDLSSLVRTHTGDTLVYGSVDCYDAEGPFRKGIDQLVAPFRDSHSLLCRTVSLSTVSANYAEQFDLTNSEWRLPTKWDRAERRLVRVKGAYQAVSYFVVHEDIGVCFEVLHPEWAFVVAYFLLPWESEQLLRIEGDTIRCMRVRRLPYLIYRAIFSSAKQVEIGPELVFEGVSKQCIEGLNRFLSQRGERNDKRIASAI